MENDTVEFLENESPRINWHHVDGPLLICRDGTLHWLSKSEILWVYMGFTSIEQLDNTYSNLPQRG